MIVKNSRNLHQGEKQSCQQKITILECPKDITFHAIQYGQSLATAIT